MTNINTPDYWNRIWQKEKKRDYHMLHNKILSILSLYIISHKLNKSIDIIDIGCGTGTLLEKIRNLFINNPSTIKMSFSAVGVDFSDEAIKEVSNKGFIGIKANIKDLISEPDKFRILKYYSDKNKFDYALCTEVLEHIENEKEIIISMLKISDNVIITVPNNRLSPEIEPEHLRKYTLNDFKCLLYDSIISLYNEKYDIKLYKVSEKKFFSRNKYLVGVIKKLS